MYQEGDRDYVAHVARYGHPLKSGFKDIIRQWRAEEWRPDDLVALYKRAGAQYFMALANHHDNMDLWNSTHQPWNATRAGPKKDLIGGWAKATRRAGMRFGVSVHWSGGILVRIGVADVESRTPLRPIAALRTS